MATFESQSVKKQRPSTHSLQMKSSEEFEQKHSSYVYVNRAYSGNLGSASDVRTIQIEPPTSVVREQYWACTKWPRAQKVLALSVGVLFGTVVGLAIFVAMSKNGTSLVDNIFRINTPD